MIDTVASTMVFLVMLIPDTTRPTLVMMTGYETAKECNAVLAGAPVESKDKFKCIRMEMSPKSEPPTRKL